MDNSPGKVSVWIVDDDPDHGEILSFILAREGYKSRILADTGSLWSALESGSPDALLLNLHLEEETGLEVVKRIRADVRHSGLPIIRLTGSHGQADRHQSMGNGCDDFLTRPIDVVELVLRLKMRLARPQIWAANAEIRLGDLVLDSRLLEARTPYRVAHLTPAEYRIMRLLMELGGQPASIEKLLVEALDFLPGLGSTEILRTHIRHLREKIEIDPARPGRLVTVPAVGYRLVVTLDPDQIA